MLHYQLPLLGDSMPPQSNLAHLDGYIFQVNGVGDDVTFYSRLSDEIDVDTDHFAVPARWRVKRKVLVCSSDDEQVLTDGKEYVVLDSYHHRIMQYSNVVYTVIDDLGDINDYSENCFVTKITNKAPYHSNTASHDS